MGLDGGVPAGRFDQRYCMGSVVSHNSSQMQAGGGWVTEADKLRVTSAPE
jgi:hypothetical protein